MTTTTTLAHGTKVTPTTPGYDVHNQAGQLVGRAAIRRDFSGRRWLADLICYDGYTAQLEGRTPPATLRETRTAVLAWCEKIDRHVHACNRPE